MSSRKIHTFSTFFIFIIAFLLRSFAKAHRRIPITEGNKMDNNKETDKYRQEEPQNFVRHEQYKFL